MNVPASMDKGASVLTRPEVTAGLIGFVVLLLFAPSIGFDFLDYDDGLYVFNNEAVISGVSFSGLAYAFTTVDGGSWMPLTWLSHQLDTTLFGGGPVGRHFTNVLLHALTAGLLFLALRRLSGNSAASLIVAGVFALHPLRNESVAWIAERKDVLSGLFFVLGLLAYQQYIAKPSRAHYAILCGVFSLGLFAKPMLVTFPFVLLLLDFWPAGRFGKSLSEARRRWWPLLKEKLPLLVLVGLASVATYWSQKSSGATGRWSVGFWSRVADVTTNYTFYLKKMFWPFDLSVVYPEHHLATIAAVGAGIGLLLVTVYVVWRAWEMPWLVVGWLWFVGMLVPVIGVVPVGMTMVADRYTYLPGIGLALAIVWQVAWTIRGRVMIQRLAFGAGVCCVVALAVLTIRDLGRWKNTETLFNAANAIAPHKVAYNNLGSYYIRLGNFQKAVEVSTQAIELDPDFGPSYSTRAMAYACLDEYVRAKWDYDEAIRLGDRPLRVIWDRPAQGSRSKESEADWEVFAAAIGLTPRTAESLVVRGQSRLKLSKLDEAIADFTAAIKMQPELADAYYWRSSALNLKGDATTSILDATRAVELNPAFADAYAVRATGHTRRKRFDLALRDNNRCIELSPTNTLYFQNRAVTYFHLRDFERAWRDVDQCRALGGRPHQSFIQALAEASNRTDGLTR